jgi:hypothetical protein
MLQIPLLTLYVTQAFMLRIYVAFGMMGNHVIDTITIISANQLEADNLYLVKVGMIILMSLVTGLLNLR